MDRQFSAKPSDSEVGALRGKLDQGEKRGWNYCRISSKQRKFRYQTSEVSLLKTGIVTEIEKTKVPRSSCEQC